MWHSVRPETARCNRLPDLSVWRTYSVHRRSRSREPRRESTMHRRFGIAALLMTPLPGNDTDRTPALRMDGRHSCRCTVIWRHERFVHPTLLSRHGLAYGTQAVIGSHNPTTVHVGGQQSLRDRLI